MGFRHCGLVVSLLHVLADATRCCFMYTCSEFRRTDGFPALCIHGEKKQEARPSNCSDGTKSKAGAFTLVAALWNLTATGRCLQGGTGILNIR